MTAATAYLNARLIDPATGADQRGGLIVEGGLIKDLGPGVTRASAGDLPVRDCTGLAILPGLIDMRVFVGEPGSEHRETLKSGSRAAAAGGVTRMIVMPNTAPIIDDQALVDFILRRAREKAVVHVTPAAAITRGCAGTALSEMGLLAEAGAAYFTDGDRAVPTAQMMLRALTYARNFDLLVADLPLEPSLAAGADMNRGELATRLGLKGLAPAAETIIIERDLRLAELTGARLHLGPIASAEALEPIARAKAKSLPVTASTTAAHLMLNENDLVPYLTYRKLMPPLRSEDDRRALVEAVASGLIDVVVSGHDPQPPETKRLPFAQAAPGGTGLETLMTAVLAPVHAGEAGLIEMLRTVTIAPATLLGLPSGRLSRGAPADLALVDLEEPWVISADQQYSRAKNTPLDGRRVQGRVRETIVAGRRVFSEGKHDDAR